MNYKIEDYGITQKQITKLMKYLVKLDGWQVTLFDTFSICWEEEVPENEDSRNRLWFDIFNLNEGVNYPRLKS